MTLFIYVVHFPLHLQTFKCVAMCSYANKRRVVEFISFLPLCGSRNELQIVRLSPRHFFSLSHNVSPIIFASYY